MSHFLIFKKTRNHTLYEPRRLEIKLLETKLTQCHLLGKLRRHMPKENVEKILLKHKDKITIIKGKRLFLLSLIEEMKA